MSTSSQGSWTLISGLPAWSRVADGFWARCLPVGGILATGLALTLFQVALACLLTGAADFGGAYERLCAWDSPWYASIAEYGYRTEPFAGTQGNTAFLPAYPLAARCLKQLFDLETSHALLLTAQLACWGFWTYLLLFFRLWRVPPGLAALGVLLIVTHPAAFFLVAGYTESLYVMALLGFLWWAERPGRGTGMLAAAHGLVMTATRIIGLPLVIGPLLAVWLTRHTTLAERLSKSWRPLGIGAVAALGTFLFFAWCHVALGQWDLYMKTSEDGWRIRSGLATLLSPKLFHLRLPNMDEPVLDPEFVSRLTMPVLLSVFVALGVIEWRLARSHPDSGWRTRLVFYVAAWVMYYVPLCTHSGRHVSSAIRFSLCVQAVLVPALIHLLTHLGPLKGWRDRCLTMLATFWCVLGFVLQLALTYRFTHGRWVG